LQAEGLAVPAPRQRLAQSLAAFRCTACHRRDGQGGVGAERDAFFTSNGEDLGDEGRLPPSLDGVGDRLQPAWLRQVLTEGAPVRPYLNVRMPQFGAGNVGHLADGFVALDRESREQPTVSDPADLQREAGRRMVGTDGLSCVACHRFNRQPAQALQVMDLVTVTRRLNPDWFSEFLLDPNRFHPGTRMPAFWPGGVSPLTDVLGGDMRRQHAALWTYLADGAAAKFPAGLSRQSVELVVGGEPVVYRGKLWEAGFRALAVGFPGQVNAAFDAEELRWALLWRGRFLNAGPHWGVQGMGQIRPLGTDVIVLSHGPDLAVLPEPGAPWPATARTERTPRFQGYQLDPEQRPVVLYSVGGLSVEDRLVPVASPNRPGLRRTLTLRGTVPAGLQLRVAAGGVVAKEPGVWRVKDALTLRVKGGGEPRLSGSGASSELRVPVQGQGVTTELEVDYAW
jgi:mono/diheme cytochrome c family protein